MWSGADINAVVSLRCAERSQATEQRYNKLKEKHTELVASHAELLRKVQTLLPTSPEMFDVAPGCVW